MEKQLILQKVVTFQQNASHGLTDPVTLHYALENYHTARGYLNCMKDLDLLTSDERVLYYGRQMDIGLLIDREKARLGLQTKASR